MEHLFRGRFAQLLILSGILAAAWGGVARADVPPAPAPTDLLLHANFEADQGGWTGVGDNAHVRLSHDADTFKEGASSLALDYNIGGGDINALLLPVAAGKLRDAKSFRFWVRTDVPTIMALLMQEKGGGRYAASFWSPGKVWQQVALAPSDFALMGEKDDPQDPDDKLDLETVQNLGVTDLLQVIGGPENAQMQKIVGVQPGPHTLFLDDFQVSKQPLTNVPPPTADGAIVLDALNEPQLNWAPLKDVKLSVLDAGVFKTPSLQIDYHQGGGAISGWVKSLPHHQMEDANALAMSVASVQPVTLFVQVEEYSGEKYNATALVPGNIQPTDVTLKFGDFKEDDASAHDNDQLDAGDVKRIIFIDASAFMAGLDTDNTLWLNNLRAVK